MSLPIIFMFSGQGSQYYHMGETLFLSNKLFKSWMQKADTIALDYLGTSITQHLYNNCISKSQPFTQTILTHPAIFMVEYALTQLLFEKNIFPDFVLGASMGEFAAAAVAGVISFEEALQTVIMQAQLIEKNCAEAGMLAILHDSDLYQSEPSLNQFTELAAINFQEHFVITGDLAHLQSIEKQLSAQHIVSQLLPVSHGFHSALIDTAKSDFLDEEKKIISNPPKVPLISCLYATELTNIPQQYFWKIIRERIQFQRTIQLIENKHAAFYVDLGPSGTLATFVKYNLAPNSPSHSLPLLTPYGHETNLQKLDVFIHSNAK